MELVAQRGNQGIGTAANRNGKVHVQFNDVIRQRGGEANENE